MAAAARVARGSVRGTTEGGRITASGSRCPLALQVLFSKIGTLICLLSSSCAAYVCATSLSGKSAAKTAPAANVIAVTATAAPSGWFTMPSHVVEARTCSLWSITACGKRPLTVKTNGIACVRRRGRWAPPTTHRARRVPPPLQAQCPARGLQSAVQRLHVGHHVRASRASSAIRTSVRSQRSRLARSFTSSAV